jgi:hypothetical protein
MKYFYILLTGALLIVACSKDETRTTAEINTYTETKTIPFEELFLLMNISLSDSAYLLVQSVDSINLFVNGKYWSVVNSQPVDVSKIESYQMGDLLLSPAKINYLVLAKQDQQSVSYTMAGEFANYLNSLYELQPGDYACMIESYIVTLQDGSRKKMFTYHYKTFRVEENMHSAYAGEFCLSL